MKRNKLKKISCILIILLIIISIIITLISNFKSVYISGLKSQKVALNQEKIEILDRTLASKITPEDYGNWAEYNVDLNDNGNITDDWKIFYNDGKYVYLIAADYLDASKIPEEAGMTKTGSYSAYWKDDSTFANKQGMENVTTETANQFMLKKYKNDEKYKNVQDINSKATAVLLDTNVWKKFALGFEGSFAYGSPTVEMWVDSWNQKGYAPLYTNVVDEDCHVDIVCPVCSKVLNYNDNGYGYRVGTADHNYEEKLDVSKINNGFNDVLYFPHQDIKEGTETYFLASPTYRQNTINEEHDVHTGGAECVSGTSEITISLNGDTKKASEIKEGDDIVYYDNSNTNDWSNAFKVGRVENVYIHKNANKFVKYTFDDGTYLEVTSYHPIYSENGWKSFTQRNGYPVPTIGDKIKTLNGWKSLTKIEEFSTTEDYYDFSITDNSNGAYFANNTLVESSIGTNKSSDNSSNGHMYTEYFMDCLVSCSHLGIVGNTQMNNEQSNAAIRPIVVLPTSTPGYYANGFWKLEKPGRLIVHHYIENDSEETKMLADDEITENLQNGTKYTTEPLSTDKYDTNKYEYTGKTTGDSTSGIIESGKTKEVTYWYKEKQTNNSKDSEKQKDSEKENFNESKLPTSLPKAGNVEMKIIIGLTIFVILITLILFIWLKKNSDIK